MSELNEKRKKLHNMGLSFIEKKMLRKALSEMAGMALQMHCDIYAVIINLQVDEHTQDVKVIVSNHENGNYGDMTHKMNEIREELEMFDEMCNKLIKINQECADFWNTSFNNITFQAWQSKQGKLHTQVKPIEGFPASEVMVL